MKKEDEARVKPEADGMAAGDNEQAVAEKPEHERAVEAQEEMAAGKTVLLL